MTDAPKVVVNESKETTVPQDKKPETTGPVAAATPVAEPAVAKK